MSSLPRLCVLFFALVSALLSVGCSSTVPVTAQVIPLSAVRGPVSLALVVDQVPKNSADAEALRIAAQRYLVEEKLLAADTTFVPPDAPAPFVVYVQVVDAKPVKVLRAVSLGELKQGSALASANRLIREQQLIGQPTAEARYTVSAAPADYSGVARTPGTGETSAPRAGEVEVGPRPLVVPMPRENVEPARYAQTPVSTPPQVAVPPRPVNGTGSP